MSYKVGDRVVYLEAVWVIESIKDQRAYLSNEYGCGPYNLRDIKKATEKEIKDWDEIVERESYIREELDYMSQEISNTIKELDMLLHEESISIKFWDEWTTRLEEEEDNLYINF